jgi:hypothetical protein
MGVSFLMAVSGRSRTTAAIGGRQHDARAAGRRVVSVVFLVIVLMSATAGVALGVVGGRTVSITAAPWTVVVREYGQQRCTGVIIDSSHILTAGHCVMSAGGDSAKPLPASDFTIEAGVSNFKHPLKSDHPQSRAVSALRAMPGYIASSKVTSSNNNDAVGHDLAVLTLSRPLDLDGDDARAAYLPTTNTVIPTSAARLVMAGFGDEKPTGYYENGTLNEVTKSQVEIGCSSNQVLCMYITTGDPCNGDSGSGAIETGPHPTVLGIMSEAPCRPGLGYYVALTAPATLRFIRASK